LCSRENPKSSLAHFPQQNQKKTINQSIMSDSKSTSTSATAAADTTSPVPSDSEDVDLGALMAPLTREQLELIIVHFIAKTPEHAQVIFDQAHKPVDEHALQNEIDNLLNVDIVALHEILSFMETMCSRAVDYAPISTRNALSVLRVVTGPFVLYAINAIESGDHADEAQSEIEVCFGTIETAWVTALRAATLDGATSTTLARQLTEWRDALTPTFGPIFSDPLRTLTASMRKRKAATDAAAAADTGTTAATSASSAPEKRAKLSE
jgi:hypothetical protein